ncbi:hypothetical protein [Lebetimonas sp. JS032]|uniref:hypothetical protein n=1 Tax=Lebetimonas sp. JS032 TaxID=990070 RepID=UPI00046687C2|nr:hypothetical protein [Lebetimonas sp. JS032]
MKYVRDDINIRILSNFEMPFGEIEKDFKKFKKKLQDYDIGVWSKNIMLNNFNDINIFNNIGEKLEWVDIVLNYLNSLNGFLREQIGVCIEKKIPRIIDNDLPYLIIQRKIKPDFDENYFIAFDKKVYFPGISKKFDLKFSIIKLVEWSKRSNKFLIKFQN